MPKPPRDPRPDPSRTEPEAEGNPLARWSRRKRLARAGQDPDAPREAGEAPEPGAAQESRTAAQTPEPPRDPTDADMPPIETIDAQTDMSGFFSSKVSTAVKRAALRKFFHNPAFNVLDGLDDYNEDYTTFEALGDIVTADMRLQAERRAEKAEQALLEEESAESSDDADSAMAAEASAGDAGAPAEGEGDGEEADDEDGAARRQAGVPPTRPSGEEEA